MAQSLLSEWLDMDGDSSSVTSELLTSKFYIFYRTIFAAIKFTDTDGETDSNDTDTDDDGIEDAQELSNSLQYELIEGNYSFLELLNLLLNRGGRLELDSSEKVSSAESVLLDNNSYIWIGLNRAGNKWKWINGSLLDDTIARWKA